ncbi:MAG TPA: hypothetical protein DHV37_05830 [Erysipelotrichaceae bacterium]|nr:hypothetical protein [Erysipelotrichaceae bacterium]
MEKDVPYIAFESMMARYERHTKRLVIALIVAIVLMFASNIAWLYAWYQYDYSSETSTVEVDGKDGIANYIGNDGEINNGTSTEDNSEENPN